MLDGIAFLQVLISVKQNFRIPGPILCHGCYQLWWNKVYIRLWWSKL